MQLLSRREYNLILRSLDKYDKKHDQKSGHKSGRFVGPFRVVRRRGIKAAKGI